MNFPQVKSFLRYFGYDPQPCSGLSFCLETMSPKCFLEIRSGELFCYLNTQNVQDSIKVEELRSVLGTAFKKIEMTNAGYETYYSAFDIKNYEQALDLVRFLQTGLMDGFYIDHSSYMYQNLIVSEREKEMETGLQEDQSVRIQLFERALEQGCRDAILINYLGKLYADKGDIVRASRNFVLACEINPYYAEPFSNMGALMWQFDTKQKGFKLFCEALLRNPFDQGVQDNFIKSGLELGEFETMNYIIEKTCDFFPGFEDLMYLKAVLLEKIGRHQDSLTLLQDLHSKNPEDELVQKFLNEIQQSC